MAKPNHIIGCGACIWWVEQPDVSEAAGGPMGQCRRYPPSIFVPTPPSIVWPSMLGDDWCGEYVWSNPTPPAE